MAASDPPDDFGVFRGEWLLAIAGDADLPGGAMAVAVILAHRYASAATRTAWPSLDRLGADLGHKTRKRAQIAIGALVEAGYLEKRQGGGRAAGSTRAEGGNLRGASNHYRLTMPVNLPHHGQVSDDLTCPATAKLSDVNLPCFDNLLAPTGVREPLHRTPPNNKRDTPLSPKVTKPAAVSRRQTASADDLRRFLDVFPASRHRAPDAAVGKALAAAMRTAPIEEILSGAGRYAAERAAEDPQFTKAATNWLRGRGWEMTGPPPAPRRQDNMQAAMAAVAEVALHSAVRFDDEGADDW